MPRFQLMDCGNYVKLFKINDIQYKAVVTPEIWESTNVTKISQNICYYIRSKRLGKDPRFKYGVVQETTQTSTEHRCEQCEKTYKSRWGLLRHIKAKHPVTDIVPTEPAEAPMTISTTNNIENQTNNNTTINNIQQNIIIRPFGKEDPKWITEKVILDALRNIPGAIMNLVKEKHFNERFPENRNVEMCSEFRNRYLSVQDEGRRRIGDKKNIFMKMCDNACDAVTNTLESYSEPVDSDESEDEDEDPEGRRCRLVANRLRQSTHMSSVVDRYIDKWQDYVSNVEPDQVLKDADHYITMLLLDLKLALAHEEEMRNEREVVG